MKNWILLVFMLLATMLFVPDDIKAKPIGQDLNLSVDVDLGSVQAVLYQNIEIATEIGVINRISVMNNYKMYAELLKSEDLIIREILVLDVGWKSHLDGFDNRLQAYAKEFNADQNRHFRSKDNLIRYPTA